jgi:hypothetical protein
MSFGGRLPVAGLPITDIGSEISPLGVFLSALRGRRASPGVAGTTTIELEINGSVVAGATLSWVPSDGAYALKTTTFTPTAVLVGDRISFRLTSSETNAFDVFVEAN